MMPLKVNGVVVPDTALLILFCSTLVTLSSGTNYVVGSWAPQYADRMHYSSTQINLVAAAGNWGVYTSGPFFGFAADKKGPRIITLLGAIALGTGYCGLCWAYSAATSHDTPISLIVIFSYLTGLGSSAGSTAGLNAVARIFPAETRGLAMGIVVAGYGLSAFLYATISGYIVGDNTTAFLFILALGTSASFAFAGALFTPDRLRTYSAIPTEDNLERGSSEMSGLSHNVNDSHEDEYQTEGTKPISNVMTSDTGGLMLFKHVDYWYLMVIALCTTGTGLMWINNVGTIVVTLAKFNNTPGSSSRLQAHQTSLLSLFNCLGRLFIGAASDKSKSKYNVRPVWWLVCLCLSFILSQILAKGSANLADLSVATSATGFAYGQFYGIAPIILLDWYGMTYFSTNVGTLYVVPTLSSYFFSNLFGQIYDSNIEKGLQTRAGVTDGHSHVCELGLVCYSRAFSYTIFACLIALGLSLLLSWRRGISKTALYASSAL